eukprot:c20846_g1_i1 orf=136-2460(+)
MEKHVLEKPCELLEELLEKAQDTEYVAQLGRRHAMYESLDYEIVENDAFKQDSEARSQTQIFQYKVLKWMVACLVGLLTGLTAFAINVAVGNIAGFKFLMISQFMENKRLDIAYSILVVSNLVLVLFSVLLCTYVAPAAAGSGIPDVKAYLNGIDTPDALAPKTLFVKIFGSIGSVAGGLATGKQGPLVHTGACIAAFINQGGFKRYYLSWRWLKYIQNDTDRQDLVTCGAAAGVAAAFNAPVGGVLFAVEEVASWWKSSLLWRTFLTTALVAVVLRTATGLCDEHKCGLYENGGLILFDIGSVSVDFGLIDLVPVITLGIIGGGMGSALTYISAKIVVMYSSWHERHGPMVKIFHGVLISLFTSTCTIGIPWLSSCTVCPSDIDVECPTAEGKGNFKHFTCPDGYYNDLASLFLTTNDNVVRNLFSVGTTNEFQYKSLAVFSASSFILALLTYGTPVPSGLFLPVIICGATYGRLLGMTLRTLSNGLSELDEGLYAVLGAASLLGGSMRTTVSICVIFLELTNNLSMLPLTMLVLLISKTTGDLISHGLYDELLRIKQLPFLQEHPESYMKHLTAFDVCSSPLVTLSKIESVKSILHILERTSHNAFPVLDENASSKTPIFHGLILRSHLLVLLRGKKFISSENAFCRSASFRSFSFGKPGLGEGVINDDVELSASEQEMYVDIHPFTNTSPYTVVDSMSLSRAYTLFRKLGLRHLCVVSKTDNGFPIVGILTRHDFMREHIFNLFPHLQPNKWKNLRIRSSFIQTLLQWKKI